MVIVIIGMEGVAFNVVLQPILPLSRGEIVLNSLLWNLQDGLITVFVY